MATKTVTLLLCLYITKTILAGRYADTREYFRQFKRQYSYFYDKEDEDRKVDMDNYRLVNVKDNYKKQINEESFYSSVPRDAYFDSRFDDEKKNFFDQGRKKANCKSNPIFQATEQDLDTIINTLHRMILFWKRNYKKIIVDGLFGMRVAEGFAKAAMNSVNRGHSYYQKISALYNIMHDRPWRRFNQTLVWNVVKGKTFDESASDKCISLLLGDKNQHPCKITANCLKLERMKKTSGYTLTHQALYFLSGETHGCHDHLVKRIGSENKLGELYNEFGSNIYSQMMKMKVRNDADSRDIFAEQALICATLGVVDCFRMDKLRKALRWVSRTGCIYDPNQPKIEKRVEAFIGRCSQHLTSVAMGYYASHLKLILDPPECSLLQ
ncbi:UPF0764 protein C16orf89 homolog isoform X2 [Hydractinia symbiolongicarpus]|uniref:UPF0764 protein C16orf89 homolog isoform X2 n=1 Tax=Hydractinia symbiolongicarpus TaxID=13093 RepID=UPI00254DA919|nr:UPF0764 protein C16orf89 homolog isoform X2 [Hydractinia symbiolongicarpus]